MSDFIKKHLKIIIIVSVIVVLVTAVGAQLFSVISLYSFKEAQNNRSTVSLFNDFSKLQPHFQKVVNLMEQNKETIYDSSYQWLNIEELDGKARAYTSDGEDIALSDEEAESIIIVCHSFSSVSDALDISYVYYMGNGIAFRTIDGRYAVLFVPDDEPNNKLLATMGENSNLVKLSQCWYQLVAKV